MLVVVAKHLRLSRGYLTESEDLGYTQLRLPWIHVCTLSAPILLVMVFDTTLLKTYQSSLVTYRKIKKKHKLSKTL